MRSIGAQDSVLDRPAALKIVKGRPASVCAVRLSPPRGSLVRTIGVVCEDFGYFVMAMELLEGTDLKGAITPG